MEHEQEESVFKGPGTGHHGIISIPTTNPNFKMQFTTIALMLFVTLALAAPTPQNDGILNNNDVSVDDVTVLVPVAASIPVVANVLGETIGNSATKPIAAV
ncbi:hypothetical protein QC762_0077000 [Podospora pseudocomata]|uniref:Uncharacterized protein n=1 Tax=Podospora pseudocomata TaxID=2093779 RepID=A0ABR0GAW7_9PEZI|nr:hypothetical protein QC762_0077000 [Podospora pseudocomata]